MRESIQESGVYALAGGCECRGYQAELKLTNKYAARFGMNETDQHHSSVINQQMNSMSRHSGNNYMMHNRDKDSVNHMQASYMRQMNRE